MFRITSGEKEGAEGGEAEAVSPQEVQQSGQNSADNEVDSSTLFGGSGTSGSQGSGSGTSGNTSGGQGGSTSGGAGGSQQNPGDNDSEMPDGGTGEEPSGKPSQPEEEGSWTGYY